MVVTVHYVGFHASLVLQGFEELRLRYPIVRVYLLYDSKRDRYGEVSRYNKDKVKETLAFFRPIEVPVNPLDFGDVFSKISAILRNESKQDQEVVIDITDMPPIAVSATTAAAMMYKDVRLYYVQAAERGDYIPDPRTPEFETWVAEKDSKTLLGVKYAALPGARLSLFKKYERKSRRREVPIYPEGGELTLEERVIKVLSERQGSADSIMTLMEWMGENVRPPDPTTKAKYSRLVRELEEKGLIRVWMDGKRRRIKLTEFGEAYAKALWYAEELRKRIEPLLRPSLKPLVAKAPVRRG